MPIGDKNKHDKDKLRWDLVPFEILDEVVRVYTVGAAKYGDNTWQQVEPGRYRAALGRHLSKAMQGEVKSEDDDLYHLACIAWNAIALLWFQLKKEKGAQNYFTYTDDYVVRESTFTEETKAKAQEIGAMLKNMAATAEFTIDAEEVNKCMEELRKANEELSEE